MTKRTLLLTLMAILFLGIAHPLPVTSQEAPTVKEETTKSPSWLEDSFDKPGESHFVREFIKMIFALGFILVLIFVGAWVFKRLVAQRLYQVNVSSNIKVIERRALSPKATVYLLDVQGKGVLVGETATEICRLGELELTQEEQSFSEVYDKTKVKDE